MIIGNLKKFRKTFAYICPFAQFGQKWIFLEKKGSASFSHSNYLPLCKKSEKTNEVEWFP